MSNPKKYSHLTDKDIEDGLKNGLYKTDGLLIRNQSNGETVKVLPHTTENTSTIPATFIQVNNTTIYHADISKLIEKIEENRHIEGFNDLEEKYNVVIDFFESYRIYKTHLPDLLKECITTAVAFENRIRRYLAELNIDTVEKIKTEQICGALRAHTHTLFIYIIVSYLERKEKFSSDETVIGKILNFENITRNTYEQLLVPSELKDNMHYMDMSKSLYVLYLADDRYDIYELERIIRHDNRFSSVMDLFGFFKRLHIQDISAKNRHNFNKIEKQISLSAENVEINSNRTALINILTEILDDIEKLKLIRLEILKLKPDDEVFDIVQSSIAKQHL